MKLSETKRQVIVLDETKRLIPCTPANSQWFGWKWPRKPSDSPEVIFLVSPNCAEARGRGKGRGLDGDCVFLEQGVQLGVNVIIEKRGIEVYGKGKKERKKERRGLGDKIRGVGPLGSPFKTKNKF